MRSLADLLDRVFAPGRTDALDAAAARIGAFGEALCALGAPRADLCVAAFVIGLCWGVAIALWRAVLIAAVGVCLGAGGMFGALLVLRHIPVP